MNCTTPPVNPAVVIRTVLGDIAPDALGAALPHEHVMCDFIGADQTSPSRWNRDDVAQVMLPYLQEVAAQGVSAFIDCSPAFLGRDVTLLQRLTRVSGLHILSNTGWYKAPYLPERAFTSSAEAIAEEWIAEARKGIDGTAVRPGFIKIAVNPGALEPVQRTIVQAAALTHLATDLTVACHTGELQAAHKSLDLIEARGMDPRRFIVVHADQIADWAGHEALFKRGAWLEYDALGTRPLEQDLAIIRRALDGGYAAQVMLSQDAGWYNVGEEGGGKVRPYSGLYGTILPALREQCMSDEVITQLTVTNPAKAFAVRA
ncbi:MAG: hypothetical protein GXY52_03590 [Chloroflexi bacterium]|nr:hypothetical protein [Chloroflexota bacterium]